MKNPLRVAGVSDSIARTMPIENTPATEAMLGGERVIKASLGHYASTLLEYWSERGVDYTPQQILDLLGITPDMLRDDSVQFTDSYDFGDYKQSRIGYFRNQAREYFAPEVKRLATIANMIRSGYAIDKAEADTELVALYEILDTQNDDVECAKILSHIKALESGVCLSLEEYVAVMLSANVVRPGDFESELAKAWISGVRLSIYQINAYGHESETLASGFWVGHEAFTTVITMFSSEYSLPVTEMAQELWKTIEPAFIAPRLADHPLITGKHS